MPLVIFINIILNFYKSFVITLMLKTINYNYIIIPFVPVALLFYSRLESIMSHLTREKSILSRQMQSSSTLEGISNYLLQSMLY